MNMAPVFILAAPFSGAAALAARLGGHPQLYAISETSLFVADAVVELLEIFEIGQGGHGDGLLRALAELQHGGQSDAGVAAAAQWLAAHAHWTTAELLQHLVELAAPRRLVMPDTDSVLRPGDLGRLQRDWPQAHIIHLIRHPWTQGARFARWLDDRLFVAADFRDHSVRPPPVDPQLAWLRINRNLEQWLLPHYAGRWQRCRDEDLQQTETLAALCAALGVASDAASLATCEIGRWPFAGYGPSAAPYGVEAELVEGLPPLPDGQASLAGALPWRADGQAFSADVVALAQRYGY